MTSVCIENHLHKELVRRINREQSAELLQSIIEECTSQIGSAISGILDIEGIEDYKGHALLVSFKVNMDDADEEEEEDEAE